MIAFVQFLIVDVGVSLGDLDILVPGEEGQGEW